MSRHDESSRAASLRGYRDLETAYVGSRTTVSFATRVDDGARVALKQVNAPFPTVEQVAQLQREHDLARACVGAGVVVMRGVFVRDGAAWIEMERAPGSSLTARFTRARPSVLEALEIARRTVTALDCVHRAGVVHKDVSPDNIVVSGDCSEVRLVDFDIASATPQQSPLRAERLEGTAAYMSPEQTGRMNRDLDWRADYYSLGATLHFLLTGSAPFAGRDALELVHAHIAKVPPSVRDLAPEVPEVVADLVATLLSKRPGDRYQSAEGLLADLDRCIDALRRDEPPPRFTLRTRDRAVGLRVSDTLYGREADVRALEEALARASDGVEAVFVTGAPGVGKSSLLGELRRGAAQRRAVFISGKYEQFQRDTPFSALLAGMREHLRGLLALDDAPLASNRERLRSSLGELASVLSEALPELSHILGPLPAPRALSPADSERRYVLALVAFLAALPTDAAPAVLLLDDLQWCDPSSAALLPTLLTEPSLRGLLVLGSWRANEVDDAHLVPRALHKAAGLGARLSYLPLAPLTAADLRALLADCFGRDDGDVAELTELLHAWTGGNPFLAHRALEGLYDLGLLQHEGDGWRWDLDAVARQGLGVDAAGYIASRIQELPEPTRRALETASCFAASFREGDLAAVLSCSRRDLRATLRPAIALRLLHPEGRAWWPDAPEEMEFSLTFAHDRVREAARGRLGDDDAVTTHHRIGAQFLSRGDAELFDVVHHLNLASARLDAGERARLHELDAEAGRRALRSGAFAAAHLLLEQSVALAPEDAWSLDPEAHRALLLDAARAASQAGQHARVDAHLEAALARSEGAAARGAALEIRARDLAGRDVLGAIGVALDALQELGVVIPRAPTLEDVQAALGEAVGAILSRPPEEILALPELDDPKALAILRLANAIFAPSYLAAPLLMPLLGAVIVRQTLALGAAPQSTYGFAILAVVLTSAGMFDPGYKIARLSLRLMDRFMDRGADVRSAHVLWGFVMPFTQPIPEAVEAHRSYQPHAMAAGDHEYSAWIWHLSLANAFYGGAPLAVMAQDLERETREMRRHGQRAPLDCTEPFRRHVRALQGLTPSLGSMNEDGFDEDAEFDALVASGSRGAVFVLQTQRMLLRYLAGDHPGVLAAEAAGAPFADGASCTYHIVLAHQTAALSRAALAAGAEGDAREAHLERATWHRAQIEGAAAHAPHNHGHRLALIDAELARARGDALAAMDGYDAAAAAAQKHGFVYEEALAFELAGRHHLARAKVTSARAYFAEAAVAWARWGATAKVRALEEAFPQLVERRGASATTDRLEDAELDLSTLSKSSLAITGELRTDRLIERVLEVCMENVGATRGMLLLLDGEVPRVAAARGAEAPAKGASLDELSGTLARIARYALRSGDALVLSNALRDRRFTDNLQEAGGDDLSALALPLTLKGRAAGLLYLENNLIADAFNEGRTRLLQLLGAQAAIALENARLYDHTEALGRAAARFVPTDFLKNLGRTRLVDVIAGEAREMEMAVLFADLRGFTGLTESLGPAATFGLLNAWLERVTAAVARHGGFIQDIVGDATLALFPGEADSAMRAAVEIAEIPPTLVADGITDVTLRVGIGLNQGLVTLGTLGSAERLAIAVVGDAVNSAARLETATKGLATQALASHRLVSRLRAPESFALRPLGPVTLHGRRDTMEVYELLEMLPGSVRRAIRAEAPRFARALASLRRGDFAEASAELEVCVERCPDDTLAAGLLARAARGRGLGGKDDVELG